MDARHAFQNFPLRDLGHEKTIAVVHKAGSGVLKFWSAWPLFEMAFSAEQKNDWAWFKGAWDEKMVEDGKEEWPWFSPAGYSKCST